MWNLDSHQAIPKPGETWGELRLPCLVGRDMQRGHYSRIYAVTSSILPAECVACTPYKQQLHSQYGPADTIIRPYGSVGFRAGTSDSCWLALRSKRYTVDSLVARGKVWRWLDLSGQPWEKCFSNISSLDGPSMAVCRLALAPAGGSPESPP